MFKILWRGDADNKKKLLRPIRKLEMFVKILWIFQGSFLENLIELVNFSQEQIPENLGLKSPVSLGEW